MNTLLNLLLSQHPVITTVAFIFIVGSFLFAAWAMWDEWKLQIKNKPQTHEPARPMKPIQIAPTPEGQIELDRLIAEAKGKFFSIKFVKKDGTERLINGKDRYMRLLHGGADNVRQAGYVPFVNRNTETWATAHKDSVIRFKCGKIEKTFR